MITLNQYIERLIHFRDNTPNSGELGVFVLVSENEGENIFKPVYYEPSLETIKQTDLDIVVDNNNEKYNAVIVN